jgi:hypothetical protein
MRASFVTTSPPGGERPGDLAGDVLGEGVVLLLLELLGARKRALQHRDLGPVRGAQEAAGVDAAQQERRRDLDGVRG